MRQGPQDLDRDALWRRFVVVADLQFAAAIRSTVLPLGESLHLDCSLSPSFETAPRLLSNPGLKLPAHGGERLMVFRGARHFAAPRWVCRCPLQRYGFGIVRHHGFARTTRIPTKSNSGELIFIGVIRAIRGQTRIGQFVEQLDLAPFQPVRRIRPFTGSSEGECPAHRLRRRAHLVDLTRTRRIGPQKGSRGPKREARFLRHLSLLRAKRFGEILPG